MAAELDNPIGRVLEIFRAMDFETAIKGDLGNPVRLYDLTEVMLVLADAQMALLHLTMASKRGDEEEVQRFADVLSRHMTTVIEAAVGAGGNEFADKVALEFKRTDD